MDTFHTYSDLTITEISSIVFRAGYTITLSPVLMALAAMPLPMFILPVLYAADFMASSTLCDAGVRIHIFIGTVISLVIAYWVLGEKRRLFLVEVR